VNSWRTPPEGSAFAENIIDGVTVRAAENLSLSGPVLTVEV
jgi:hypothetical protein